MIKTMLFFLSMNMGMLQASPQEEKKPYYANNDTTIVEVQMNSFIAIGWGHGFSARLLDVKQGEFPIFKDSTFTFYIGVGQGISEGKLVGQCMENKKTTLYFRKTTLTTSEKINSRPIDYTTGFTDKNGVLWRLVK